MALKPIPQPLLRIRVLRDLTNSPFAAGIGQPWMAYCRCCARDPGYGFFATFNTWDYAIDWALQHARTTHPRSPLGVTVRPASFEEPPC
jgi:hypothetical protein